MDIVITLPKNLWLSICSGKKKLEVRKGFPKKFNPEQDRCFVILKGFNVVVGYFYMWGIAKNQDPQKLWELCHNEICVDKHWYDEYTKNTKHVCAWIINSVYEYQRPHNSSLLLNIKTNPQSYYYISNPIQDQKVLTRWADSQWKKGGTVVPPTDFQSESTESSANQDVKAKTSRPCAPSACAGAHAGAHESAKKPSRPLNVLIACEESQAETEAFRNLGHNAFSCDVQLCRKGHHPEWHIHDDVTPYLQGGGRFITQDGEEHYVDHWDLIIAHPPCTYLCKLSSVQLKTNPNGWIVTNKGFEFVNLSRWKKLCSGREFFFRCLNADATYVAVENPIPMKIANLPKPTAYACPSWFGVKYTKKTLYWLKNLPPLFAEIDYNKPKSYVNCSRGKYRSRTFPQMAEAIARQWSAYILDDLNNTTDANQ